MASSTAMAAGDDAVGTQKGGAGGGGGTTPPPATQQQQPPPPPAEQGLRCPRCDSPNTKFCYYNNYSLSQPRHFCKTCRRYWTKGGALRNVPVGGGCRKNKRSRSAATVAAAAAAAASSRLSLNLPIEGVVGDQQAAAVRLGFLGAGGAAVASSPIGGGPTADYQQAGAAVGMMALQRLHAPAVGQYVPFGEWPSGAGDISGSGGGHGMNDSGAQAGAVSRSIASSIESLSFINQDLHWKLQQQRLATMFLAPPPPPPPPNSSAAHVDGPPAAAHHIGGAFLQMAGPPGMESTMPVATSWFMDSSYGVLSSPAAHATTAAAMAATTTNCNVVNSGRSSGDDDDNAAAAPNTSCGSAIPSWGDMSTFAMLP